MVRNDRYPRLDGVQRRLHGAYTYVFDAAGKHAQCPVFFLDIYNFFIKSFQISIKNRIHKRIQAGGELEACTTQSYLL